MNEMILLQAFGQLSRQVHGPISAHGCVHKICQCVAKPGDNLDKNTQKKANWMYRN